MPNDKMIEKISELNHRIHVLEGDMSRRDREIENQKKE